MNVRWAGAGKVLCVRLDNMGDVLMTTPAMHRLRASLAGRQLTLLTSPSGAALAPLLPDCSRVIAYDAPWTKSIAPGEGDDATVDQDMIERLRAERFDAAVIFTCYSQSALPAALLCRLAGIPLRLAHCRENPYALLTDWVPESEPEAQVRHEVQRQLDLVAAAGGLPESEAEVPRLVLQLRAQDHAGAEQKLQAAGLLPGVPLLVMHPGATAASRRYPADRFAAAARVLVERLGCVVIVTGGEDERILARRVAREAGAGVLDFAGVLALGEFAALLSRARLLIANNSGPVHLAAAVGTPVVDLYALTNPQHTPWQVPHRVLFHEVPCRYCYKSVCPEEHHLCLEGVGVEAVIEAALALWNGDDGSAAGPTAMPPPRAATLLEFMAAATPRSSS